MESPPVAVFLQTKHLYRAVFLFNLYQRLYTQEFLPLLTTDEILRQYSKLTFVAHAHESYLQHFNAQNSSMYIFREILRLKRTSLTALKTKTTLK